MPQLSLNFLDIPIPQTHLWESLDNEHKQLFIETLARVMVKATEPATNPQERRND
jgi:hypothetical protein